MNKYQEALDSIGSITSYNSINRPLCSSHKKQFDLLQELVDRATPKNVYYEHGQWCCKSCGEQTDRDDTYCRYCGQRLDD